MVVIVLIYNNYFSDLINWLRQNNYCNIKKRKKIEITVKSILHLHDEKKHFKPTRVSMR